MELIAGRHEVWLGRRWRGLELAGAGSAGAFFAPAFSGLDTLPALGIVVLSLSVLLEDALIALVGSRLAAAGITLERTLGGAALHGISSIR